VFSARARPGAPISAPVAWSELATVESADAFTVRAAGEHVRSFAAAWKGFEAARQALTSTVLGKVGIKPAS
jgi:bifunctional non-homologous end joining protein LigD